MKMVLVNLYLHNRVFCEFMLFATLPQIVAFIPVSVKLSISGVL